MRDIKFRGQRKDNGEWVYGGIYILEDSTFIVTCYGDRHYIKNASYYCSFNGYEVIPETVGQFTGLKDREGNELDWWEGDIFRRVDGQVIGYTTYKQGCFWFKDIRTRKGTPLYDCTEWGIIKCGNIHENPGMLK